MKKKGFTIVELLMVVAVLAVLTGIITTAASSAIKPARARRTDAAQATLQNGIAAYYAQHNYWPPKGGALDKWSENGLTGGKHVAYLDDTAYDARVYELLRVSVGSSASSPERLRRILSAQMSQSWRIFSTVWMKSSTSFPASSRSKK